MPEFRALIEGYERFRSGHWRRERERWEALAEGQSPPVMVIGCADSRVDPATIFDCAPGEVFAVRNVANLVPPFEGSGGHGVAAAIEYAVLGLAVRHIVVLGHGACGGVRAALYGHELRPAGESLLTRWIALLDPAKERVAGADDPQRALELEGVRQSLANLLTFPFVADAVAAGGLRLHGAHFGIADGVLRVLGEDGRFEAV